MLSVVLGDANVLYSRVVRDYLLYAMAHQLIRVTWSAEILGEVVEHLIENVEGFDVAAGERLVAAMNGTFPYAQVDLTAEARAAVSEFTLPDEDDRHVIAAAVSAEAAFLCTEDRTARASRPTCWQNSVSRQSRPMNCFAPSSRWSLRRCLRFIELWSLACAARPMNRQSPRCEPHECVGRPNSWTVSSVVPEPA